MKKLITKFWGVVLIVILLSTMFVAATPVSANALQYSAETYPNTFIFGTITAGAQILDMAINGDTIYVANGTNLPAFGVFGLRKSTTGGSFFVPVTVSAAGVNAASIEMVAVAADDPNFVVAIDTASATDVVYISSNGGSTWSNVGAPRTAAGVAVTTVTGLSVSPAFLGGHYIGVSGITAGAPRLAIFNTAGGLGTGWFDAISEGPLGNSVNTYAGTGTGAYAIEFSPSFPGDLTATFVTANATGANFEEVQFTNTGNFNTFPGYPVVVTGAGTAAGGITKADIALFPDYSGADETLRNAFVALDATTAAADGLYRLNDTVPSTLFTNPSGVTGLNSVAYVGTSVVVGSYDTNIVAFSNAPLAVGTSAVLTASRALKRSGINDPGNDQVVVGIVGTTFVSGKRGAESAFAVSADGGLSYNDVALVNTGTGAALTDIAYSADGTEKYALIDSGNATSLWHFEGFWSRVLTLDRVTYTADWIIRTAPETFDSVYIGNVGSNEIFYSSTAGASWNTRYTAPGVINDIAVESANVMYVAYGNLVAKSNNHAFYFGTGVAPSSTWGAVNTVKSYGANQILVTSSTGNVQWSTDGGVTYQTFLAPTGITGGTATYAVADKLEMGGMIYAATAANANVYRWTIGTSAVWDLIGNSAVGTSITATYLSQDIALSNGVVYRLGTDGTNTEISRSINAFLPFFLVEWSSVQTTGAGTTMAAGLNPATGAAANAQPAPLKMVGTTAYFVDTINTPIFAPTRVLAFTDTLAAPTAVPALSTPANDGLIQTNPSTGGSNPVTFTWTAVAGASLYQIAVAQDAAFLQPVAGYPFTFAAPAGLFVTNQVTAANLFVPGQSYYWRVRVASPYWSNWSAVNTFRVQPNTAIVPTIGSPANGSILSGAPAFSWSPIGGATMYKFEVDTGTTFVAPLYSVETANAGASLPTSINLVPGKTYFWRVKALAPIEGDWSTVANFTVAEPAVVTTAPPAVTPTLTVVIPPGTTVTTSVVIPPVTTTTVNPTYIWAIIIIGAVLVIAVIVLIVRTRRSV